MSTEFYKERADWKNIQERKKLMVHMNQPYEERIRTFNLKLTKNQEVHQKAEAKRMKNESLTFDDRSGKRKRAMSAVS